MLRTPVGRRRLDILEWLKEPARHFPPPRHADAIAAKLGVRRRVADTHLVLLTEIGLLRAKRIRRRVYYRRDDIRIAEVARMFEKGW